MNPISFDMLDLLVEQGVGIKGSKDDWGLYRIEEPPNEPLRCVTLFDQPGTEQSFLNNPATIESGGFQVRVRSFVDAEGYQKIREIRAILHQRINFEVNGQGYGAVMVDGATPVPLPKDDNDRFLWVQSFMAHRQLGEDDA